jgi:hypothetical protein
MLLAELGMKCEQCDYRGKTAKGLAIHVGRMHRVKPNTAATTGTPQALEMEQDDVIKVYQEQTGGIA